MGTMWSTKRQAATGVWIRQSRPHAAQTSTKTRLQWKLRMHMCTHHQLQLALGRAAPAWVRVSCLRRRVWRVLFARWLSGLRSHKPPPPQANNTQQRLCTLAAVREDGDLPAVAQVVHVHGRVHRRVVACAHACLDDASARDASVQHTPVVSARTRCAADRTPPRARREEEHERRERNGER